MLKVIFLSVLLSVSQSLIAESMRGTAGISVSVSPTVAIGEGQFRFNTRMTGTMGITIGGAALKTFSLSCVGQDTMEANKVIDMSNDCVVRETPDDLLFARYLSAENKFLFTGGEGKWEGASGFFNARFEKKPSVDDSYMLFFVEVSGDISD